MTSWDPPSCDGPAVTGRRASGSGGRRAPGLSPRRQPAELLGRAGQQERPEEDGAGMDRAGGAGQQVKAGRAAGPRAQRS